MIKGSNFDGFAKSQTSISYKKDLLGALNDMFCKKMVFMDACYSGKAVQGSKATDDELELSGEIAKLVSANAGTRTFVSCSAKQLSYEDAKWQNGAFTKALLEAFNAVPNKKNVADKDKNGVVNIAELYDYVYVRVPEIIKTKKDPKPQTEQTPFMPESQRREDLPIFAL